MKKYFTILFLFPFFLNAFIKEAHSIRDVFEYLDANTLLIFDIDNTLLKTNQMFGSDEFFYARLSDLKKTGKDPQSCLEQALFEWHAIQMMTGVTIVEPGSHQMIQELKQKGCKMIALTTRGLELASRTTHQLKSVGIDFKPMNDEPQFFLNPDPVLFINGILFTTGTQKGVALFKLLDRLHERPKKVVFLNDKASHLRDVEGACIERGVEFVGLRYGYLDEYVKSFNPDIAEIERLQFRVISDDEALLIQK